MPQICIVLVPKFFHDLDFVSALLGREACRVGNPVPFVVLAFLGKLVLVEVAPICEDIIEEQTPSLTLFSELEQYDIDPEGSTGDGTYTYPNNRIFNFGINITF